MPYEIKIEADAILGVDDWITCPACRVMRLLSDPEGCNSCRKNV